MQCCHNSNNDKLALLDTIYNQTFKHFTHLIYFIIFFNYYLPTSAMEKIVPGWLWLFQLFIHSDSLFLRDVRIYRDKTIVQWKAN